MNIEPDTHIEIRQTRSEISVLYEAEYNIAILDEVARKLEGVIDDVLLTRLGYMKRETCHPVISDNLTESEGTGDAWADCSECGHLLFVLTDPNSEPPNYCPGCGRMVE